MDKHFQISIFLPTSLIASHRHRFPYINLEGLSSCTHTQHTTLNTKSDKSVEEHTMEKSPQKKQTIESDISHFKLRPYVDSMRETLRSSNLKLQFRRLVEKARNEKTNEIQKLTEENAQAIQKLTEENARAIRKLTEEKATLIALLNEKEALLVDKREPCDCLVNISVRDKGDSRVSLDVKRSDTIKEVKATILHKKGLHKDVRPSSFYLRCEQPGRALPDEQTVAQCDVESGSRLALTRRLCNNAGMEVRVSVLGGGALLRSSAFDTVGDLKLIVQEETGIRAREQHLTFDGRKLGQDTRKLCHYNIGHGSTICLGQWTFADYIRVCVTNVMRTKQIMLEVHRFDKIGSVKKEIRRDKGMPLEGDGSFGLFFQGSCLDEDRTVGYYDIVGGSTLYVVSSL